ncbi:hypothetical protein ACFPRL_18500 [Pseudoclavibacter helvolus]
MESGENFPVDKRDSAPGVASVTSGGSIRLSKRATPRRGRNPAEACLMSRSRPNASMTRPRSSSRTLLSSMPMTQWRALGR